MHYYQFHVGDYLSSTSHLSNEEDLAYRRLLDMYYTSEKPIPLDTQWVSRRLRVATETVESVLRDFFVRTEEGYSKDRCQQEIEKFRQLAERNKRNGSLGGRPKNPLGSQSDTSGIPEEPSRNPNHEPITNNQEPIDIEPKGSLSGSAFPPCPQREILWLWKEKLPHLAQPRIWEGSRAAALRQRWVQASKPSAFNKDGYITQDAGLEWWGSFFNYIAKDTKLSNGFESQGRVWKPDLEWVVNATNFQKIIDGKYDQ
jgi:uncharacterized protein YdaU (DUF1376 family)